MRWQFPDAAVASLPDGSDEFITFNDPQDLQDVLDRGTLEQWQLFLHPDQRTLVERTFSGPARLRGISGSGKTVVALHRAKRLAKAALPKGEKILFTTFDKGLAAAASRILGTLCGPERAAIEVTHLHRWCLDYPALALQWKRCAGRLTTRAASWRKEFLETMAKLADGSEEIRHDILTTSEDAPRAEIIVRFDSNLRALESIKGRLESPTQDMLEGFKIAARCPDPQPDSQIQ